MSVIRVLSAGAPKGGVSRTAEAFEAASGHGFDITFATAPVIKARVLDGKANADVVVATVEAVESFADQGLTLPGAMTVIGSIKAGVAIRVGAEVPDISTAESLKRALLDARSIVRNEASSGLYIARMIEGLGIAAEVADKTVTLPTGGEVLERLAAGTTAKEIGFGQLTEIRRIEPEGKVRLVGPLPRELENVTTYAAAPLAGARDADAAKGYVAYLATDAARELLVASGVE
jgi:molybdate transport system substrate-binding protein